MPIPSTREELKEYCLRRLGAPVIEINVDDEQVEDRLDDALQYFADYHYDGVEQMWFKHLVTEDDVNNTYIDVPEEIISVVKVLPLSTNSSGSMFNIRYQFMLNEVHNFTSTGLLSLSMTKDHIANMNHMLGQKAPIRFNRHTNKMYLDTDWENILGHYIVVKAYRIIDPETEGNEDVYNDMFVKEYATQLIKQQWGANLTKFSNIQLPGGVQFDGQKMYDDATAEIERIKDRMIDTYSEPVDFIVG